VKLTADPSEPQCFLKFVLTDKNQITRNSFVKVNIYFAMFTWVFLELWDFIPMYHAHLDQLLRIRNLWLSFLFQYNISGIFYLNLIQRPID
jgi:hypothetical protein